MKRALVLAMACVPGGLAAQEWSVSGTNTLRWERYDTRGNAAASPYPFSLTTGYDELVLNLLYQPSSFDRWRGLVAGVANDSPYRSPRRGFVPERLAFVRENGEAAIPYRVEAGDFFAFTSVRTQQRPLKGAAVEVQPGWLELRHSLLLFGGAFHPHWRSLQWSDDHAVGGSWLVEHAAGRLNASVVHNERRANAATGAPGVDQDVASLAAEVPFATGPVLWRAEAEVASLRGDPDGPRGEDGRNGALFGQLSGTLRTEPLTWRLRGERYGRDYRPVGAAIPVERRSAEAHLTWQSAGALTWRGRVQDFRDGWESSNPLDTRVVGAAVSGPVPLLGHGSLDVFRQDLERADGSQDQRTWTANAHASRAFGPWLAQAGAVYQRVDDRLRPELGSRTRQLSLGVVHALHLGPLVGTLSPGVVWREVDGGPAATRDVHANLQLALQGGPHRFSLSAGRLAQDPAPSAFPDVATVNLGLDYRFRWGRHELGADLVVFDRDPRPGQKTEAYRAGVSWTYAFDVRPVAPVPAAPRFAAAAEAGPLPRDIALLAAIAPGDDLAALEARLAQAGLAPSARLPGALVYEARLMPEIEERQRLVIAHSAGRVDRVAVLVALADAGAAEVPSRLFERARRTLIERFGRPAITHDEGTFGPSYARDLAAGRFVRVSEWITDRGRLRLGIPRRLDGIARIEIQHARAFPSPTDPAWGLEAVR